MSLIGSIWQNLLFAMREMLLINNLNTDFQYNTVFLQQIKKYYICGRKMEKWQSGLMRRS